MECSFIQVKEIQIQIPTLIRNEKQVINSKTIPIKILKTNTRREIKNDKKAIESEDENKLDSRERLFSDEAEKNGHNSKEDEKLVNGGYGTISKTYGISPSSSYVDYAKLFSYLGKFKSNSPYENATEDANVLSKSLESGSFGFADKDSMDKIGRFDKYMRSPVMAIQTMALSLVPIAGLSSGEWEEIKMMMKLDSVMYTLKTKIS